MKMMMKTRTRKSRVRTLWHEELQPNTDQIKGMEIWCCTVSRLEGLGEEDGDSSCEPSCNIARLIIMSQ